MALKPESGLRNADRILKRRAFFTGRILFSEVRGPESSLRLKDWVSLTLALAFVAFALLGQRTLGAVEQGTAPLTVQLLTSSVQETRPGLVVLVLDHSRSMKSDQGVPAKYRGLNRWQAAIADAAERVNAALEIQPGMVDVRVYRFDTEPARYDHFKSLPRLTKGGGGAPAKEYLQSIRQPEGLTALFRSVRNIAEGLVRDDALGSYSWISVVLYSDGDDSEFLPPKSRQWSEAERSMCEALNQLSKDSRVVIDYLPIGNGVTLLNPDCGGLRKSILGEAKRPMIYQLSATPDPLRLSGAGTLTTRLQWKGPFPDTGAIRFDLAGQPSGLSVARDSSEDRLIWTVPDTLADGAQFSMVVSAPHPDGGQRILSVTNQVRVPPLEMPPQIGGLPPPCAEDGGARVLLKRRGEVVEIQPLLPNDALVRWVVSPGGETQNGPVFRKEGLQSGRYEVSVTASRGGTKEVSDKVMLYVIEPLVKIQPATAGGQPVAGETFDLIAVPQGNPLPEFLRKRLSTVEQAWAVAGQKQKSRGMALSAVFPDFGKLPVDFNAVFDPCDSKGANGIVGIHGSSILEIKAGVSIEDLTGSLVEGYPGTVKVDVSDRDLVDHVEISVDGGRNWRSTRFEGSTRQHAEAIIDPPFAWKDIERLVETRPSGERFLKVLELPIRRLPDGTVSKRDDPKNQERQKNVDIPVIKPNVELSVGGGLDGAEVDIGRALKLQAEVSGAQGNLVKRVEIRIKSGAPAQRLGDMTRGDKPANSNFSSVWWSEAFKPTAEMGKDVILEFVAFDGDGGVLKSHSIKVRPTPPKPVLVSSQGQVIRWSGGPENIPTVVVNLLESGTKEPFPAKDVVSIQWKVTGALELVSQPGDRSQTASFRPVRRGDATLEAVVQLGNLGAQSATLLLKVDPVPLREENKPQFSVIRTGSDAKKLGKGEDFWLRGGHMLDLQFSGEVGAFQERRIELIRGGETNLVASEEGISFAGVRPSWALWRKAKPLPCAVKISWVAWGEPGSPAVVRQESFDAVAAPPVSAWIALPVAALVLIYVCIKLGFRNSLLGQWVQWETLPHKRDLSRFPIGVSIGVFSRTNFNLWSGDTCLRIPKKPRTALGISDPLAWMDKKILSTDQIIISQLKDGKFPNRLSSKNSGLKASLSNQVSGGVYQVVPSNSANNPQPIFFIISDGIGEMKRALIALLSFGLILSIFAGCVFQLIWRAWPRS